MTSEHRTEQHVPITLTFQGGSVGEREFVVVASAGQSRRVPCYWSGGKLHARVVGDRIGRYTVSAEWLDEAEPGARVDIEVVPYSGNNSLLAKGPLLRTNLGDRHLFHSNEEPFLWLSDTWWYGLGKRVADSEMKALALRRQQQGFTAVKIVAGLHVDVEPFDPVGDSHAGWPWHPEFSGLNTEWWDEADKRIGALVESALVPCIVGAWGYYLEYMTDEQMKEHWLEIIARWGSWPVVWVVAGEVTLPFYSIPLKPADTDRAVKLAERWLALGQWIIDVDPWQRPVSAHPAPNAGHYSTSETFPDASRKIFDIEMLQTGHSDLHSLDRSMRVLDRELNRQPHRPVINVEVNYEGIGSGSFAPDTTISLVVAHAFRHRGPRLRRARVVGLQRMVATSVLPARGGDTTWQQAADLPGAEHVGLGRNLPRPKTLARLPPHDRRNQCGGAAPGSHSSVWCGHRRLHPDLPSADRYVQRFAGICNRSPCVPSILALSSARSLSTRAPFRRSSHL